MKLKLCGGQEEKCWVYWFETEKGKCTATFFKGDIQRKIEEFRQLDVEVDDSILK